MKLNRYVFAGAVAIAALAAFASAPARASNVTWSVGVHAAPGVHIGATNAQPYYVQPAPVYVQPQPVYVQPQVQYYTPGYYVRPAPVYPIGYYYAPAPRGHWQHGHRGHRGYGGHGGNGHRR